MFAELQAYELKVRADAHEEYGAMSIGSHDDLATALGLCVVEDPYDYEVRSIPFSFGPGW